MHTLQASRSILLLLLLVIECLHGGGAEDLVEINKGYSAQSRAKEEFTEGKLGIDVLRMPSMAAQSESDLVEINKGYSAKSRAKEEFTEGKLGIDVLRMPSMAAQSESDSGFHQSEEVHNHQGVHPRHVHGNGISHMDHMDPATMVFFTLTDLKKGKTMPIHFPKRDPASSPHLLPRDEADSIPLSLNELPNLLELFSFPQGSPQAKAMEDTLKECESEPIKGEIKSCATSLESTLDFVQSIFGRGIRFRPLSTTHLTKSDTHFQNYTILEIPQQVPAPKIVACHTMPYPYTIFYCHSQETKNKVFEVSLGGENGDLVNALAVCHMDTSQWSRNHASFRLLGFEPGTFPVCHFFPADHFVWVPRPYVN